MSSDIYGLSREAGHFLSVTSKKADITVPHLSLHEG